MELSADERRKREREASSRMVSNSELSLIGSTTLARMGHAWGKL